MISGVISETSGTAHPWCGDLAESLERFRAKWAPVRVRETRQNKNLKPRSDSIGTEKALAVLCTVRVATTDLCAGCQQSFARDMIDLQPRAVRILEQHRVVAGGEAVLSRCVDDMCVDLYKEVIRLIDIGTFSRTKTVVV